MNALAGERVDSVWGVPRDPPPTALAPARPALQGGRAHAACSGAWDSGVSFFFPSRRRHTRCSRDWSSDVCSSDLDESLVIDARENAPYDKPFEAGCSTR